MDSFEPIQSHEPSELELLAVGEDAQEDASAPKKSVKVIDCRVHNVFALTSALRPKSGVRLSDKDKFVECPYGGMVRVRTIPIQSIHPGKNKR